MAPEVVGRTAGFAHHQSGNASSGYCAAPVTGGGMYDGRMIDMWSCGVVLYVCAYGEYPFEDADRPDDNRRTWYNISTGRFALPEFVERAVAAPGGQPQYKPVPVSGALRDLISRLLVVDPARRPSAAEVLAHPFLAEPAPAPGAAGIRDASFDLHDWGAAGDLFSSVPAISPALLEHDMGMTI